MYGNTPFRDETAGRELTTDECRDLRRELSILAARTRELLPGEFVVGSELTHDVTGPRATVAVQPPVGAVVSANYTPDGEVDIDVDQRESIAVELAASAALQVKEAMEDDPTPTAR